MVPNSHLWLLEAWLCTAAAPRATATTGGLKKLRASDVVCISTPGRSANFLLPVHPLRSSLQPLPSSLPTPRPSYIPSPLSSLICPSLFTLLFASHNFLLLPLLSPSHSPHLPSSLTIEQVIRRVRQQ
ncbi:unnamed protein product [Schistocephalus solidus]|uniref:Secreted protein n=1 Tax=Schistocephalus solidus TaxID=70667 RepID=A0A183SM53_SCHSO|nr:unnamed protein product [Schistocephalus solidus]